MTITAFDLAQRFVGLKEVPGATAHPQILAMLSLDVSWPKDDEVPWCSGFANYICWLLRLPRSKSLLARSWLLVGQPVPLAQARVGFDVVVLNRGGAPSPDILTGPGHVGFYAGHDQSMVTVLGGNQGDQVSLVRFKKSDLLGVRRLLQE